MKKRIGTRKGESGNVLITALIMLSVGSIMTVPLMSFMDTGIGATQIKETKVKEFYAANAGIEDALNKIRLDSIPAEPYTLPQMVNNKTVDVNIDKVWLLDRLEDEITPPLAGEIVVMGSTIEIDQTERWYRLDLSCESDLLKTLPVNKVAVWLPIGFSYITGSTLGITTSDPVQISHHGGKVLKWNFSPAVPFVDLPIPGVPIPPTTVPVRRALAFKFTPGDDPQGSFPWLTTTNPDHPLYWDEACASYKITATAGQSTAESYVNRGQLTDRVNPAFGDYRVIGNTLIKDFNNDSDHKREAYLNAQHESSASIEKCAVPNSVQLPTDANILLAYLYWSAWFNKNDAVSHGGIDAQITFKINSGSTQALTADSTQTHYVTEESGMSETCVYSGKKDVTSLVQEISIPGAGTHTITVGGMDCTLNNTWSYAGWSLILVYSSPGELAHQLYLYDTMTYGAENSNNYFSMSGFSAPADSDGRLTYFIGEGDNHLTHDWVKVKGEHSGWGSQLNDGYGTDNVLNGKSMGLGGFVDGVDIDTFDISTDITEGDTSTQVRLKTGTDSWTLVYMILSFRNEVTVEWQPYPIGVITYTSH